MLLVGKNISTITEADVKYLIENKVSESITLDYKRELPGNADGDKKEFLADVLSFANTLGGVIVFGIGEEKDEQGHNTGLPCEIVGIARSNLDQEKQRLESIIREGTDPRISTISISDVTINEKSVLLLGISRSLLAPHMVGYRRDSKFYGRNNTGKFQMDATQIRFAFLEMNEWENAADEFRQARIQKVRSLDFIPTLEVSSSFFIQAIPLGRRAKPVDLVAHSNGLSQLLQPLNCNSWGNRFNLEGYVVTPYHLNPCPSYIQYFRAGGLEIYGSRFHRRHEGDTHPMIWGGLCEKITVGYLDKYFRYADTLQLQPPIIVFVSFHGVKGMSIITPYPMDDDLDYHNILDRDELLLPGIIIENIDADLPKVLRPLFDMLWQAAGLSGSPYYKNDVWTPPK